MLIHSNKCLEAQLEETGFTSAQRKKHAAVPEIIGLTGLHRLACIVNYTYLQLLNHTFRDSCRVSSNLFRGVCTLPLPSLSCPYTLNYARLQDRAKYDTLRQREAGEPSTQYNSAACCIPEERLRLQCQFGSRFTLVVVVCATRHQSHTSGRPATSANVTIVIK